MAHYTIDIIHNNKQIGNIYLSNVFEITITNTNIKNYMKSIINSFNLFLEDQTESITIETPSNKIIKQLCIVLGFAEMNQKMYLNKNLFNICKLKYPLLKFFIKKQDVINKLNMLKSYSPIFLLKQIEQDEKGRFTHINVDIKISYNQEKKFNNITNYFSDECRIKCQFKDNDTYPYRYYFNNKGNILHNSLFNQQFDYDTFENYMFKSVKFCNNFQVSIVKTIIDFFNAKTVFDSSAGWGDRLIGSIAANAKYTGVDPSECLENVYTKIINTLTTPDTKHNYNIFNIGIEDIHINDIQPVDLCLSSPPFDDLEVYENNNKQSINKFKGSWLTDFLIPLAQKNIDILKSNGYFALYIPPYQPLMDFLNNHQLLQYVGTITFVTPKRRPIYIWRKK